MGERITTWYAPLRRYLEVGNTRGIGRGWAGLAGLTKRRQTTGVAPDWGANGGASGLFIQSLPAGLPAPRSAFVSSSSRLAAALYLWCLSTFLSHEMPVINQVWLSHVSPELRYPEEAEMISEYFSGNMANGDIRE
ncbi:hypothetical protein B0T26DRAFT_676468 [Lasiosphaeria miniovina]|uniref:Uncharacterized protein n=1 Tax=Lasiosphaeria miniovina TaxID=1954250 RepID=A0AA40AM11_9PEZI|nr:uncharacterized protein B0T26DRAFT_676468 [Lasiosphaeria miniovina]KAK0718284.1 hypothetical protein B0T26DRAFT_676468 [Lasiosphaeria miniovina]